jgi:hypothetical protein
MYFYHLVHERQLHAETVLECDVTARTRNTNLNSSIDEEELVLNVEWHMQLDARRCVSHTTRLALKSADDYTL